MAEAMVRVVSKLRSVRVKYVKPADCLYCDSPGEYVYKRYFGFFRVQGFTLCSKCLKKVYILDSETIEQERAGRSN